MRDKKKNRSCSFSQFMIIYTKSHEILQTIHANKQIQQHCYYNIKIRKSITFLDTSKNQLRDVI